MNERTNSFFNEESLEKKFSVLNATQDCIQTVSLWILHHRSHYEKIVKCWFKHLRKASIPHRLTLFYLANDVIQNCKRKNAVVFHEEFRPYIADSVVLVKDESIRKQVERIFEVWKERNVYEEEFTEKLIRVLNEQKETNDRILEKVISEFQPKKLCEMIYACQTHAREVTYRQKIMNAHPLDISPDSFKLIKDRNQGNRFCTEFDATRTKCQELINLLEKQIFVRKTLVDLMEQSEIFYDAQYKDAKVVVNAYKGFGSKVHNLKRKLDELKQLLPESMPSPSYDAPSPGNTPPDCELSDMDVSDEDNTEAKAESRLTVQMPTVEVSRTRADPRQSRAVAPSPVIDCANAAPTVEPKPAGEFARNDKDGEGAEELHDKSLQDLFTAPENGNQQDFETGIELLAETLRKLSENGDALKVPDASPNAEEDGVKGLLAAIQQTLSDSNQFPFLDSNVLATILKNVIPQREFNAPVDDVAKADDLKNPLIEQPVSHLPLPPMLFPSVSKSNAPPPASLPIAPPPFHLMNSFNQNIRFIPSNAVSFPSSESVHLESVIPPSAMSFPIPPIRPTIGEPMMVNNSMFRFPGNIQPPRFV